MLPDFVSTHLVLGHLGCALVQLAGLESQEKKPSQLAHNEKINAHFKSCRMFSLDALLSELCPSMTVQPCRHAWVVN